MLAKTMYDQIKALNSDVGNLRVSHAAVEFDLLAPSSDIMGLCLKNLAMSIGETLTIRELDVPAQTSTPARAVENGVELFNEERYWESHESLEAAWRNATNFERETLQGIILLAASLVHLQKDEPDVALSIIKRADVKLPQDGTLYGIDLRKLKRRVEEILSASNPSFFKIPVIDEL